MRRRSFVRHLSWLAAAGAAGLASCRGGDAPGDGADPETPLLPLRVRVNPPLARLDGDAVMVLPAEQPRLLAYVSRRTRRVYVDRAARDRVQDALRAHISVSTGHWRIPGPEDPPLEPLTPGVPEREFEEVALTPGLADDGVVAAEGDLRVVAGRAAPERIELRCREGEEGLVGGPWAVLGCAPAEARTCRQALVALGEAFGRDAACAPTGTAVRVLAWSVYG